MPYTGFSTADAHNEWLRAAFGLKNAPAFFNRMMFQILGDLTFVQIYLDDIFIGSESEEKHLDHISIVIYRLKNAKLRINFKKCNFFKTSIKILGHIISENNVMMDPEKIEVVKNWKTPSKVVHIQQFIGLCGYYRKFIENFAKIAAPLYTLLKKDIKWNWSIDCDEAFNED